MDPKSLAPRRPPPATAPPPPHGSGRGEARRGGVKAEQEQKYVQFMATRSHTSLKGTAGPAIPRET
ncbi:hypothetical protein E2C01_083750 [Portunus trituberculatus]|uniref:Uncharacterized protein n=1 Tax=Portunus trituberculatus TaxID=210409 RepID=A0A5B7J2H9_PORTR|nr:hypothetical protein [Portunus trituberculatus]